MNSVSETLAGNTEQQKLRMSLYAILFLVALAFIPAFIALANGAWQTEQDGHGPFILAACAFFVWRALPVWNAVTLQPAPWIGWPLLAIGLAVMVVSRSQGFNYIEVFSLLPIITGIVTIFGGLRALRIMAFPIALLIFVAPAPSWALDAITMPLKIFISDAVTRIFYTLGYPIAQNGVVILIGPYQLLVKDACAGLNSIFALSAIGFIYVEMMNHYSIGRRFLLLLAIVPIAIATNFLRVAALVLIAYYFGSASVEGIVHDLSGFALFIVAFIMMVAADALLGGIIFLTRWVSNTVSRRPAEAV